MKLQVKKFCEEVQDLIKAKELLNHIYAYIGPYPGNIQDIPDWLRNDINDYFGFDDSE